MKINLKLIAINNEYEIDVYEQNEFEADYGMKHLQKNEQEELGIGHLSGELLERFKGANVSIDYNRALYYNTLIRSTNFLFYNEITNTLTEIKVDHDIRCSKYLKNPKEYILNQLSEYLNKEINVDINEFNNKLKIDDCCGIDIEIETDYINKISSFSSLNCLITSRLGDDVYTTTLSQMKEQRIERQITNNEEVKNYDTSLHGYSKVESILNNIGVSTKDRVTVYGIYWEYAWEGTVDELGVCIGELIKAKSER